MQDKRQLYLLTLLLFVFGLSILGAYFYGERDQTATASSAPMKKFRAKEGTERKGARALVSSRPSVPEETTSRPIDIWGSFERDDAGVREKREFVEDAIRRDDPEAAIEKLLEGLEQGADEQSGMDAAYTYAALASLYLLIDPPDPALAEEVYAQALKAARDAPSHVLVVNVFAGALLHTDRFERLVEVTELGSYESYPFSARLLEIGVLRGLALEKLDRPEAASASYQQAIDAAIGSGSGLGEEAANVFRQASLRLARLYRAQGKPSEANAVARRVRALLDR